MKTQTTKITSRRSDRMLITITMTHCHLNQLRSLPRHRYSSVQRRQDRVRAKISRTYSQYWGELRLNKKSGNANDCLMKSDRKSLQDWTLNAGWTMRKRRKREILIFIRECEFFLISGKILFYYFWIYRIHAGCSDSMYNLSRGMFNYWLEESIMWKWSRR